PRGVHEEALARRNNREEMMPYKTPLKELEQDICALLEDVIYSFYHVLDSGVFDDLAEDIGRDAIGRINNFRARLGWSVIGEEEYVEKRDSDTERSRANG